MSKRTYALDFETYYDKKVSITELGPYHYLHHPMTDIYMVAVVELVPPDETEPPFMYCGEPDGMPWEQLRGAWVVAHNASFDEAVFKRLVELGKAPDGLGVEWCCTADLCAFLGTARSLKEAEAQEKTIRVLSEMSVRLQTIEHRMEVYHMQPPSVTKQTSPAE